MGEDFSWGALLDKGVDTVGKLLAMDAAAEQAKLDNRLAETRLQAELYGMVGRPMNARANAQSYGMGGSFFQQNAWAMPALLLAGAFLIYSAAK